MSMVIAQILLGQFIIECWLETVHLQYGLAKRPQCQEKEGTMVVASLQQMADPRCGAVCMVGDITDNDGDIYVEYIM